MRNEIITNIIENKYKSLIPINKFPVFILFIDIEPTFIDVNIHPTKQEVKFLNQEQINSALDKMLSNALNKNLYIQKVYFEREEDKSSYNELPLLFEKNYSEKEGKDKYSNDIYVNNSIETKQYIRDCSIREENLSAKNEKLNDESIEKRPKIFLKILGLLELFFLPIYY